MKFHEDEKMAVYIDGANFHATAKALGLDIDFKKLRTWLDTRCRLIGVSYYTAVMENDDQTSLKPLIDWLSYNGYNVVTKPAKQFIDSDGRKVLKGNMDIELAVDALAMADFVDHVVIVSGDGDFRALVAAIQKKACRVTVLSTTKSKPPMIADELRRQVDNFIEISTLADVITRAPLHRND